MAIETSGGIPATMLVGPTGYGYGGYGMGYGMGYGNGMFGGDWASWIILFLIFGIFGGNGFGGGFGGGAGFQGALTRADLCQDMNFQSLENGVRGIQQGLCDGFYAVNTSMLNGFHGVDNAICSLGYQFQAGLNGVQNQIADCCCKTQTGLLQLGNAVERGFCDTNYAAQTNATAIMQNAHNDTDRILARLDAIESARKDETIAELRSKLAAWATGRRTSWPTTAGTATAVATAITAGTAKRGGSTWRNSRLPRPRPSRPKPPSSSPSARWAAPAVWPTGRAPGRSSWRAATHSW